ncbi:MAG: SRPBCC family protein [Acidimicrobiales bacterium]
MTVINTTTDRANLTLTVIAEFEATPEEVWEVWEDARKLERWWGPPCYPATFTRHEFAVGGESRYFMTAPAGNKHWGWWRIRVMERPNRLEFANGLAGDDGEPAPGLEPIPAYVTFAPIPGGTRMTVESRFLDVGQMETMLDMGMQEGMALAVGQIDGILAGATV